MERPAGVSVEPCPHLWMLVYCVIVEDRVHGCCLGKLRFDLTRKPDELLMPMSLHILADDCAIQDVESSKQRRRPISLVVMGHGSGVAFF